MARNQTRVMYIELKSGHGDCGPARIGRLSFTKSGQGIRYKGKLFERLKGSGVAGGNYFDAETGDEYWISGPKKDGTDRHWAGGGPVVVDPDVVEEYWQEIRKCKPRNSEDAGGSYAI